MKGDFSILAYTTMPQEAGMLSTSCAKYGYTLYLTQEPFVNFRQFKIEMLIDKISNTDTEYVMYTDAMDSFMLNDFLFFKYFAMFGKDKVVVSANRDHYPQSDLYKDFPDAETSFRYVCSSQFIGRKDLLLKVLTTIRDNYAGFVDQEGWQYCIATKKIKAIIDTNCELFLNMTNVYRNELTNNFMLKETKSMPCSIHFGGPKGDSPNGILMKQMYNEWCNLV